MTSKQRAKKMLGEQGAYDSERLKALFAHPIKMRMETGKLLLFTCMHGKEPQGKKAA